MDTLQVSRVYYPNKGPTICRAEWDCKKVSDHIWRVHFHADYVPSDDFYWHDCVLMTLLDYSTKVWMYTLDSRFAATSK